jgi:hypothetical protein
VSLFGAGEQADYQMARDRTSRVISQASANLEITQECQDQDGKEGWVLHAKWKIKTLVGSSDDSGDVCVGKVYFTQGFREKVRAEGGYQHPKFKLTHDGYDGRCDDVTISDIQAEMPLEDAKLKARVCDGIPVIHAETLDLSGKYRGSTVKLGLDYGGKADKGFWPF